MLNKEKVYSKLSMEKITDANYKHAKKVWKYFEIKNLSECHGVFVHSNTFLLTGIFETFRR